MNNIAAAKAVADIVRTTLGPKSMLKMLLDPMGGIVITNDGNAILREIDVAHPAAKNMLELARSQDEEVGDGTTSVIILAGELLVVAEPFLTRAMHPTVIVNAYHRALEAALDIADKMAVKIDTNNREEMRTLMRSCIGTKFSSRYGDLICDLALDAVTRVAITDSSGRKEIDIKRYAKVEKFPGGELSDCRVLDGVMVEKDVTHPRMRRRIENPRVVLLDCPLEYKKAESAMNLEITKEEDFEAILKQEEDFIAKICADIIALKPDLVITEKGVSDLASHFFVKAGITSIRRIRKTDNLRVGKVTGATIVSRPEELQETDVGTLCGLFEVKKMGDEYFMFLEQCRDPKACTILLRGGSMDVLKEFERNLQDAMQVARNVVFEPKLLPGGGATEMSISVGLSEIAKKLDGVEQWPFRAVGQALEVVPRTIAQNAGSDVVRVLTELRASKLGGKNPMLGIDGDTGKVVDMQNLGVLDPFAVRTQVIKASIEAACMLLRIDDILSGMKNKKYGDEDARKAGKKPAEELDEQAPNMEE
jgi:T-complex protein 1 subunit gamma